MDAGPRPLLMRRVRTERGTNTGRADPVAGIKGDLACDADARGEFAGVYARGPTPALGRSLTRSQLRQRHSGRQVPTKRTFDRDSRRCSRAVLFSSLSSAELVLCWTNSEVAPARMSPPISCARRPCSTAAAASSAFPTAAAGSRAHSALQRVYFEAPGLRMTCSIAPGVRQALCRSGARQAR